MLRRHALRLLGSMTIAAGCGRLFAAPASPARFLLVFLRGGYDCANVLIPYASNDYYALRPNIAVPRPGTGSDGKDAVRLDDRWALAPALRDTVAALYGKGQVAFVPFAGTTDLSRSHFETQDAIELGQFTASGERNLNSGFMARLASQVSNARPIAFTDSLPVAFRGDVEIPSIAMKAVGKPGFDEHQSAVLASMYANTPLQAAVRDGLELRQQVSQAISQEMTDANRNAITPTGFELEAQRIARLMREQYRIGFVDVGGWDTHVNEGAAEGQLASNLTSLGKGLAMLSTELGSAWNDTVVVVVSEFGRTFRENGDKGTDHGHGSVYWVLGGGIKGGRIAGEQVEVTRANLFQDRDFPVLNDYRSLLGGLFKRSWGLGSTQLEQIFPGAAPIDLGLV